jgi:hypothetical protein
MRPTCDLCGQAIVGESVVIYGYHIHELCLLILEDRLRLDGGRGTPAAWSASCPDLPPGKRGDGHVMRKPSP